MSKEVLTKCEEVLTKEELLKRKASIELVIKNMENNLYANRGALQLNNLLIKEIEKKEAAAANKKLEAAVNKEVAPNNEAKVIHDVDFNKEKKGKEKKNKKSDPRQGELFDKADLPKKPKE